MYLSNIIFMVLRVVWMKAKDKLFQNPAVTTADTAADAATSLGMN
jgi:hypothetical protein